MTTPTGTTSEPGNEPQETTEDQEGTEPQSAREAKYRERAKTAETQSATDRAIVERLQAADAQRLAGEHLANPADLFDVAKVELADLLTDEGFVDSVKIQEAAEKLIADRGEHFAKPRPPRQHGAGGSSRKGSPNGAELTAGQHLMQDYKSHRTGQDATSRNVGPVGTKRVTP